MESPGRGGRAAPLAPGVSSPGIDSTNAFAVARPTTSVQAGPVWPSAPASNLLTVAATSSAQSTASISNTAYVYCDSLLTRPNECEDLVHLI